MGGTWVMRLGLLSLLVTLAVPTASGHVPTASTQVPVEAGLSSGITVKTHHPEASRLLNQALSDSTFWNDAWSRTYTDKSYDQIRLKELPSGGYFPMIGGEGDQDFDHDVVAHIIFERQTELPKHMAGAKAVVPLGRGYDNKVGAEYNDVYFVLDLTFFYATYPQRMYRRHDEATHTTVLWFEKLEPAYLDESTWRKYEAIMTSTKESLDKRWTFNAVFPVGEVFGMFVVTPGKERESRVTFISKLSFDDRAGWIARVGSKIPGVIRSGLKSGFLASVAITREEQARRAKTSDPEKDASAQPSSPSTEVSEEE